MDDLNQDVTWGIRFVRGLMDQIKIDYVELNRLWKMRKKDEANICIERELTERLSWINQSLYVLSEMRKNEIEEVISGEIGHIEKEVGLKEVDMKKHLFSVLRETEKVSPSVTGTTSPPPPLPSRGRFGVLEREKAENERKSAKE